ncbi:uncharacterized protein LOC62_08G009844 [Vanrija pseudolonga]|uniref:Uncharacterized protein n=1 Tax=Vanrija pseudolonga TaxID=143232 RepID=A0AAF0YGI3_9TREE|nr:hypothetical protein LOC62_08G009844 [Vanrija pseudolonga]
MDEWCDDSSMHEGHGVMRDTFLHEATLDIGTDPDKNRNATLLVSCQDLHTLGSEAEKRTFNTTILPKRHDWEVEYNTLHTWDVNMIYHHGFDGTKYTSLADPGSLDLAGGSWSQRCMTWYRQHIGTPALFGYRHVQSAWGGRASLSTGLESIVAADLDDITHPVSFPYLMSFLDTVNVGTARLWNLERDLHLNSQQFANVTRVFFVSCLTGGDWWRRPAATGRWRLMASSG